MPSPQLDINTGVSIAWTEAPLLVARKITDVTLPGSEVETFDSSHQGTTTAKTKIPADLVENSPFEFTVQHKQDADYFSEVGKTGSITITLPHSGSTLVFDAILKSYSPQNAPFNEPMYADVVIEVSGDVAVTAGG